MLYSESHVWGLRKGNVEDASQHRMAWLVAKDLTGKPKRRVRVKFVRVHSCEEFQSLYLCPDSVLLSDIELKGKIRETSAAINTAPSLSVTAILTAQEINAFCLALGEGSTSSLCQTFFSSPGLCASSSRLGLICQGECFVFSWAVARTPRAVTSELEWEGNLE